MIYLHLFWSFIKIGAFSFGGGYACLPLIQEEIVSIHHWLSIEEFSDLITLSQMTPGPIAINAATFVGTQIAGIGGALVATLGCVLPSIILVTLLAHLYMKYRQLAVLQFILKSLRPAVVAMIGTAGVFILVSSFWGDEAVLLEGLRWLPVGIFAFSLYLLLKFKLDPVKVMVIAGVMNIVLTVVLGQSGLR